MLDELHVTDLALVRDATLFPASGLTAITGETGAGKTALVSALALVAGGRADAGAVREGAQALQVEARFICKHEMAEQEREVVVSRQVTTDGRSRVHIDGSLASVGQLAEGVGATLDLCGQHEHQQLLHVSHHREMLDSWGFDELVPALTEYAHAYAAAEDARRELSDVQHAGNMSKEAIEQARYTIQRIDEIALEEGEYENVRSMVAKAENFESLAMQVGGASEALSGDGGTLDSLSRAAAALEDASRTDAGLAAAAQSLREASYIIEDVARDVRSYRDTIEFDPQTLASLQDRMGQIQGLLRSFGPTVEEVFAARERAEHLVASVDQYADQLSRAEAAYHEAEQVLKQAAHNLHDARCRIAPRFAQEVTGQMQRLELAGSALECAVELKSREQWTLTGPDHIEFMFKPAADLTAKPLVRIASGGETSRVMLAIKVVLGSTDTVDTLVFDEVDAGVGGSAARALADVLADLARTHQVIVVTHLAQVAVLANTHYVVRKTGDNLPETTLEEVRGQARVAEVARMLSGDASGVSRAHAAQMLEDAHHLHTTN